MRKFIAFSFILVSVISACNRPPELPVVPTIEFEYVRFKEADGADSLLVSVYFKDGDGDLGLHPSETFPPYNPYDVVFDNQGDSVKIGSSPDLPPYNPVDYIITFDSQGNAIDTVLVELNENHYNFFVRFFEKKNGEYIEFKWRDPPYFQTFDGRFPLLNTDFIDNQLRERPLEGSLRYGMTSNGWLLLFRDTLKLTVHIQDRMLNKSNVVETPDFTLESITVK